MTKVKLECRTDLETLSRDFKASQSAAYAEPYVGFIDAFNEVGMTRRNPHNFCSRPLVFSLSVTVAVLLAGCGLI
ncbi:MAG: hypothetical protein ACRD4F_17875, partial [Candidatus Angelobacter sp.]